MGFVCFLASASACLTPKGYTLRINRTGVAKCASKYGAGQDQQWHSFLQNRTRHLPVGLGRTNMGPENDGLFYLRPIVEKGGGNRFAQRCTDVCRFNQSLQDGKSSNINHMFFSSKYLHSTVLPSEREIVSSINKRELPNGLGGLNHES